MNVVGMVQSCTLGLKYLATFSQENIIHRIKIVIVLLGDLHGK
jgi:hypothetical protein